MKNPRPRLRFRFLVADDHSSLRLRTDSAGLGGAWRRYVGEWAEGKRSGRGKCAFADGGRYEGEWAEDRPHGKGSRAFAGGERYQGEWREGRRHGFGVCVFADGRKFKGEWEDNAWVQSTAEPALCRVMGPGLSRAVAGQPTVVGVEAFDERRQRRLCGGDDFSVRLESAADPSAVSFGTARDNGDGTYVLSYSTTAAGPHVLHILLGMEEEVAESPYPVLARAAPRRAPRRCTPNPTECAAGWGLTRLTGLSLLSVRARLSAGAGGGPGAVQVRRLWRRAPRRDAAPPGGLHRRGEGQVRERRRGAPRGPHAHPGARWEQQAGLHWWIVCPGTGGRRC